jgi:hypothetical protein
LVELHENVTRRVAADFLRRLIEAVPYRVHNVLTDNGPTSPIPPPISVRFDFGTLLLVARC